MEEWMWIVWLIIFAITMIVEVSVSGLVAVWISLAALVTLCLSFINGLPYWGEMIIFIGLSFILLAATRPFVKKLLKAKEEPKTNLKLLIGKQIKLEKKVEPFSIGEAKINGVTWDCETEDNSTIEQGKVVEIVGIKGNKLIIKEVE